MSSLIYPTVEYPTIVEGRVWASTLRVESLDGSEMYLSAKEAGSWRGDHFHLINYSPRVIDGKTWGVSHEQRQARRGWLKVNPDCYHQWYFWKPQEYSQNPDGGWSWKPGTERGIYFRKSRKLLQFECWRWDVAGTVVDGVLRHWIRSGGYGGGHWD